MFSAIRLTCCRLSITSCTSTGNLYAAVINNDTFTNTSKFIPTYFIINNNNSFCTSSTTTTTTTTSDLRMILNSNHHSRIHRKQQMCTDTNPDSQSSKPQFSGEIPMGEIEFRYSKSGGPGGQHVNKVETKAELRFNVKDAHWIPEWIKPRLIEKEANRITKHGELIVTSDKTRKQILNQADCLNRLRTMIFDASKTPKEPTPEEIALAEKRQKKRAAVILKEKRHHSLKKMTRGSQGLHSL